MKRHSTSLVIKDLMTNTKNKETFHNKPTVKNLADKKKCGKGCETLDGTINWYKHFEEQKLT